MLEANKPMKRKLLAIKWHGALLPENLLEIAKDGFSEVDGCFYLTRFLPRAKNVRRECAKDRTGYECFVNALHMDYYVQYERLMHACIFVEVCFTEWRRRYPNDQLQAIASVDGQDAHIRMHMIRPGESWHHGDIEGFGQPVLVADSRLTSFSETISQWPAKYGAIGV